MLFYHKFNKINAILLPSIVLLLFWLPLILWLTKTLLGGHVEIPETFPILELLERTFNISIAIAIMSVLAAYPIAIMWRLCSRGLKWGFALTLMIPLAVGFLARNYSWIGMLSGNTFWSSMGWYIFRSERLLYSEISLYLVMTAIFIPIAFFIIIQGIKSVRSEQIYAARILGLADWKILFFVVIPMTLRAAVISLGFIFIMSTGYFVTPRMIGAGKYDFVGNAILIFLNLGRFDSASTISLIFLVSLIVPVSLIAYYTIKRRQQLMGR